MLSSVAAMIHAAQISIKKFRTKVRAMNLTQLQPVPLEEQVLQAAKELFLVH